MKSSKANPAKRWRWWIIIGIAVLGGLIAAGGYVWVHAISADNSLASTAPGVAVFLTGSVIVLGALIAVRARTHPDAGGHVIWVSVGVAGVAISLNLFGLSVTDPTNVASFGLFIFSLLVGAVALITFLIGALISIALLTERRTRH